MGYEFSYTNEVSMIEKEKFNDDDLPCLTAGKVGLYQVFEVFDVC